MAHTKQKGAVKNLGDSGPKYLGVKLYEGQQAKPGSILVRQRGTKIIAGNNVRIGKDHTLYAIKTGIVKFAEKRKTGYDGKTKRCKMVSVLTA